MTEPETSETAFASEALVEDDGNHFSNVLLDELVISQREIVPSRSSLGRIQKSDNLMSTQGTWSGSKLLKLSG